MTRIISGEWRGHALPKLKRGSVRPTTDRARTIMFDTLSDVRELNVLDLFSGTGALGFEALSRGAKSLVSIDRERHYIVQQNAWISTHPASFRSYCGDVLKVVSRLTDNYDLILADPPYNEPLDPPLLLWIERHLSAVGRFVYERSRRDETPLASQVLQLAKEKVVAETKIQIYKAAEK